VKLARHSRFDKRHGAFTRALAFLLLGFIVYGTTAEAAHTHGNLAVGQSTVKSSAVADPASDARAKGNPLSCNDCLICQLHQHFSTSVLSAPLSLAPPVVGISFTHFSDSALLSHTNTTRRGRAPPFSL
jgi:hypothetical protein